ncbi:hypothetical protein [Nocardioides convexus]|uniref:hypothetical protein n=1 Tax=Nocardioides convexus TaxID=2712224 RepID=UPI0024189B47|nr:hypothetical protein [Nocardioides convexus]
MQIEIKRIQTEVGLTFVHVTHDQEEAMTMADTIAVMNGGVIEQMGSPTEALREPPHHLRRQLPRPVQPHPGHRDRRGGRRRTGGHARHPGLHPRRAGPRPGGQRLDRRASGEGARRARGRADRRPRQPPSGRGDHRRRLRRGEHAVPGPDALGPGG